MRGISLSLAIIMTSMVIWTGSPVSAGGCYMTRTPMQGTAVTKQAIRLRSMPCMEEGDVVATAKGSETLTILQESDNRYQVKRSDGTIGWIYYTRFSSINAQKSDMPSDTPTTSKPTTDKPTTTTKPYTYTLTSRDKQQLQVAADRIGVLAKTKGQAWQDKLVSTLYTMKTSKKTSAKNKALIMHLLTLMPTSTSSDKTSSDKTSTSSDTSTNISSTTTSSTTSTSLPAQVITLVNQERSTAGLTAMTADDKLNTIAQSYAQQMYDQNFFDHTDPKGVTFDKRITNAGYKASVMAENIAMGQQTAEEAMKSRMNSKGHKENILASDITHIGVGYYKGYRVQVFATPMK